jgi:hypothetical protein
MATRESFRDIQENTAALRQIPLATVIPIAFPTAAGPTPGQGRDVVQWQLPDGSKVNVKTTGQSDLYRVWSGPQAGRAGTGAINFLVDLGVCPDFPSAKAWLQDAVPTLTPARPPAPPRETPPAPFQMPHFYRNPTEAWPLIADYLTDVRQLPAPLLRTVIHHDPPAILAGWGPKYGHYLLFPCWDHSQPLKDSHPTGAILRWRHADHDPAPEWFGGNPRPMAPGSHKQAGWWQIGPADAATLIITEAPIDGLTVAASLPTVTERTPDLPAGVAICALGGEAGFTPPQLVGHHQILIATDNDAAGARFAAQIRAAAQPGQIVERVSPPAGYKDWNAVWQAQPALARVTWARALEASRDPEVEAER